MKKILTIGMICLLLSATGLNQVRSQVQTYILPPITQVRPSHSKLTPQQLIGKLPSQVSLQDPYLKLVNKENPVNMERNFDIAYTIEGDIYDAQISSAFQAMLQAGMQAGYQFVTVSAFRSTQDQENNRVYRYQTLLNSGLSEKEAQYWLDAYYAPGNATEHLTGWAFDILGSEWMALGGMLTNEYAYTPSGVWLMDNAHQYGFILRYPEGKTDITGYHFEPWHFRYVGKEHARFMYEYGLTLEEYLVLIREKQEKQVKIQPTDKNKIKNNLEPDKKGKKI